MNKRNIAIIGAGYAGRDIASEIQKKEFPGQVIVFFDDDKNKIGAFYDNIPILGPLSSLKSLIKRYNCDEAIIAMPTAEKSLIKQIYEDLKKSGIKIVRIVPALSQVLDGDAHLIQTREITVQDLLGRKPVAISLKKSLEYLRGKRVLITGAGGSIGGELARQLLHGGADRLYLFDHGENNVYEIDKELRLLQEEGIGEKATIVPVIGELKDKDFTDFLIARLKADIVFHCAAYKHVPMLENNPVEAVKNNIFGTRNLLDAAIKNRVKRFVLISTDKAVNPTSTYGITKQVGENMVLTGGGGVTDCMVVRFGNVLDSRGSIVPLFRDQLMKGGPLTITHEKATRFFMTIPEASSLVLQAGGVGENGKLYILDMGEPVAIKTLAEQMIRFYGYTPGKEIKLKYIGLRKGEKIEERLWLEEERVSPTEYPRILCLNEIKSDSGKINDLLKRLGPICFLDPRDPEAFRNRLQLRRILHDYCPSLEVPPDEPQY